MRSDLALMLDMLIAARKIQRYTAGLTLTDFNSNELIQSAVIRELQVIGEAARVITEATRTTHPEINWRGIAGMRNRLVHQYFSVSVEIVWGTIQTYVPRLVVQLENLLPPKVEISE
jgi:uncharacterized protein with HEPN domain